jgi:hypothetical protein
VTRADAPLGIDTPDVRRTRALSQLAQETVQRPSRAFRHNFNRTIRAIANVSLESQRSRPPPSPIPETHPLDFAKHYCPESGALILLPRSVLHVSILGSLNTVPVAWRPEQPMEEIIA